MALPVANPNDRDRFVPGVESLRPPQPETAPIEGEYEVVDNDDGSADVIPIRPEQQQIKHGANLAEHLSIAELNQIGLSLRERLDEDKQARSKRDEIYAEGIRRSGLGNDAPGGANFEGASRVVHPMIAEACVDFCALAMRELFPADGPVKPKIFGVATPEKIELGDRQARHMNWQLTEQMEEYPAELEQVMTQLGMGGSQFMKFWNDGELGRATCEFVPVDDMLLPFAAADFWTSPRITHVMHLTKDEVEARIARGTYREIQIPTESYTEEQTKAAQASDKVEGKQVSGRNIDDLADYPETNGYFRISIDGDKRLPYLVTLNNRNEVLAIYRNWDEEDRNRRRLHWIVEFGFIPWRGAYKIGFTHLIGGLSAAATGALRAFLDSAHVNNAPTAVKLKSSRISGQSTMAVPTQIVEIEGPAMVDDIRKLAMALPFNPPSPALFQLIGWLTDTAKGVVTTAEEKIAEATNQMPVGTALALIESGGKVISSIHARLHRSQHRALKIIARLNRDRDIEAEQREILGEVIATRQDYAKALACVPVSDPNIFSDAQRYAQNQALLQLSTAGKSVGVMYNDHKIHERILRTMKIPQPEEILPPPQEPKPMNIAATDVAIMLGQMMPAFPGQDHSSHLEARFRLAADQVVQVLYLEDPRVLAALLENIKMHAAFMYGEIIQAVGDKAAGTDIGMIDEKMMPQVDRLLAAASKAAHAMLERQMTPALEMLKALQQKLKAAMPPPPTDPVQVASADSQRRGQTEQAKLAQKTEADQRRDELKAADLQQKAAKDAREQNRKDIAEAHDQQVDEAKLGLQAVEAATPGNQIVGV